jgi:hypothetical protein
MTESQEKPLATWLMENIVKGDGYEYLEFEEISSKPTSILPKKKFGQLVLKLFSNVERKTGCTCMDIAGNWIFIFKKNKKKFVKYSTFAAPELFTFNIIVEDRGFLCF